MKLHWGKAILIFFIIFLSLAAFFIVFSFRQNNDLVEHDYYEQGANYTGTMLIKQRSVQFNDSIVLKKTKNGVNVIAPANLKKRAENIRMHFYFPANEQNDFHVNADKFIDNMFISTNEVAKGRYTIKLSWQMDSLEYYIEKTLNIE